MTHYGAIRYSAPYIVGRRGVFMTYGALEALMPVLLPPALAETLKREGLLP